LIALLIPLFVLAGCKSSGRRPIALPGSTPSASSAPSVGSPQGLYESGRYREVLSTVTASHGPEALFFAAQSSLRLGQSDAAAQQFAQLPQVGGSAAWQVVSDLGLALIDGSAAAIDRARGAAAAFPDDPFVQYELGLAHVRRDDVAGAAAAFDRCSQADPRFAYAYYNAGLVYDRLNRADVAIARFEVFQRLAPDAPERPEVSAILRTVR
jgi:tetratricopeptide (TPR) repeat protein